MMDRVPLEREETQVYGVAELTSEVKNILEAEYSDFWVRGEISNLKTPSSGHSYFTLKDDEAQLRAVLFRGVALRLSVAMQDGLEVLARGHLTVYEKRGDYQLIVTELKPAGKGALYAAFEKLKQKLADEGFFEPGRKRPLPLLPRVVGVVTSPTGAAFQDILNVLGRRFRGLTIVLCPVQVQGQGAAAEIAQAIRDLNEWGRPDVLIVGRGGGTIEDLWAFNEEEVARAIFGSHTPIISAVGHETDVTISDWVADMRAPTPSAAAELVAGDRDSFLRRLDSASIRMGNAFRSVARSSRSRLDVCLAASFMARPDGWLSPLAQTLDDLSERLEDGLKEWMAERRQSLDLTRARYSLLAPRRDVIRLSESLKGLTSRGRVAQLHHLRDKDRSLENVGSRLQALNPLAVLQRGYCVVSETTKGHLVTRAQEGRIGTSVNVVFADGRWECRVEDVILGKEGEETTS